MKVPCPICRKEVEYSPANAYRPFCSERCKMIDLGEWADGKRAVPGDHDPTAEEDAVRKPRSSDPDRQD